MEFVSMEGFLQDILPEVPGCSNYTVIDRVRWAAIQFCKETGVSVETTTEMDLDADEPVIDIPSPSNNVQPWQVLWVKTTFGPVDPMDRRSLVERGLEWEGRTGKWPLGYVRLNNRQIQLAPTPEADQPGSMSMHCSYVPTREATKVDAVLFDEYREAIVCGALSKLLNMSKEEWYDPSEARERRDLFAIAINHARALADKDFTTGEQRVQMCPMA